MSKAQILIVDDEPEVRSIIASILADEFHTLEAEDGLQAIDLLANHKIDVILTDFNMPGLNGMALAKRLQERAQSVPIVMLTGRGSREIQREAVGLSIVEYVEKPFNVQDLLRSVKTALVMKNPSPIDSVPLARVMYTELHLRFPKTLVAQLEEDCLCRGSSVGSLLQQLAQDYLSKSSD